MDQKQIVKTQRGNKRFVELTLKEEASLAAVTLVSGLQADPSPGI